MDGICAVEAAHLENPEPPRLPPRPTELDRATVLGYLSDAFDRFQAARTILDRLGSAPVPEGEELVAAQRQVLIDLLDKLSGHVDAATDVPAPDLAAPLRLAALELAGYSVGGPHLVELTERYPTLAEAYEVAPRC